MKKLDEFLNDLPNHAILFISMWNAAYPDLKDYRAYMELYQSIGGKEFIRQYKKFGEIVMKQIASQL